MALVLGAQDQVLLCLFFPYSSFNSMKNSEGKKKVMFGFDIPTLTVKEAMQRAGRRGVALGGHAERLHICCCATSRPGHAASVAGPSWREETEAPPAIMRVHLEGNRHTLSCLAQFECMFCIERHALSAKSLSFSLPHQVN